MSGSFSARNCISSNAAAAATAVAAWLANIRSACRRSVEGSEPVLGLVGPDDADELARAVVQRDDEPVVVPGQRAAAVARRLVGGALDAQPRARLVAGQQEAALDLELGVEQAPQGPRSPLCDAATSSGVQPTTARGTARCAAWSMSSTETLLKPSAARMPAQTSCRIASIDIVWVRRRGHAQQLLERGAVAGRLGRGAGRPARPGRRGRPARRGPRGRRRTGARPETARRPT